MATTAAAQEAAEAAVGAVGCGYDLTDDLRLFRAKPGGRLLDFAAAARDLVLPGGAVVPAVPAAIVTDKGERSRFRSDVLSFSQVNKQFIISNSSVLISESINS